MAAPLVIRTAREGDRMRMCLAGEVDLAVIGTIRDHVGELLARDDVRGVVVDLSSVSFMDSSGIGEFIRCKRLAAEAGKTLRVVNGRGRVAEVLELSGMTAFFASA